MPREQYAPGASRPFSIKEWTDDLSLSRSRLMTDAAELPRLSAMANAMGKISGVIKNDLQRLKQMGVAPSPENAVIPYHS